MVGRQLEQLEHAFVLKVETEMKYSCHFASGQKKMEHTKKRAISKQGSTSRSKEELMMLDQSYSI